MTEETKTPDGSLAGVPGSTQLLADSSKAVAAYAMLARDPMDFIEYVREELDAPTKELLLKMLTTPNPRHDRRTIEVNELGAQLLSG